MEKPTLQEISLPRAGRESRTKSLNNSYLTISSSSATVLKVVMIGVIPVCFLLLGIDEVLRRRKMV